ncbi:MAG: hypothetical protein ABSB23_03985 [Bryobacteraceae bacterium]|jgi:hypothetical protein
MNHLNEEQLVLHYYGEESGAPDAAGHLEACGACRQAYASLERLLRAADDLPAPEPAEDFGARIWQRIAPRLAARRTFAAAPVWRWAAAAGVLLAALLAGQFYYPRPRPVPTVGAADPQAGERVLRLAVSDYLDRSQMVLAEVANADPQRSLDIFFEQKRAADLVVESRLYRQTALRTGDAAVAGLLDDLDRVMLEITHGPARLTPAELARLRDRLDREGILFKIRVLGADMRAEQAAAARASSAERKS